VQSVPRGFVPAGYDLVTAAVDLGKYLVALDRGRLEGCHRARGRLRRVEQRLLIGAAAVSGVG
jgi:hypothetical protein